MRAAPRDQKVGAWRGLPDPRDPSAPRGKRCRVHFTASCWRHIVTEHGRESTPLWNEWLGAEVWRALNQEAVSQGDEERWTANAVSGSAIVEPEVRRCLEHHSSPSKAHRRRKWVLVLHNGALAVIRNRGAIGYVCTVYFPDFVEGLPRSRRWLPVLQRELSRGTELCLKRVRIPKPGWRFVTPRNWGWKRDLDGEPWRPPIPPWSANRRVSTRPRLCGSGGPKTGARGGVP